MFVGRQEQLEDLESLWCKRISSLVACRGHRRIGKSMLSRKFVCRTADVCFEFDGLPPDGDRITPNHRQLAAFAAALARQTNQPIQAFAN